MSVSEAPALPNVERQLQEFFYKKKLPTPAGAPDVQAAVASAPAATVATQEVEVIDFVASTTKDLNTTLAMYFLLAVGLRIDRAAWLQQQFEIREAWRPIVQTVLPQAREFLAHPLSEHLGKMWRHRTVRRYVLTAAVARRLVRFLELVKGQLAEDERVSKEGWELAVKLDPALAEFGKIKPDNIDPEKLIPVDWSRLPRRTA